MEKKSGMVIVEVEGVEGLAEYFADMLKKIWNLRTQYYSIPGRYELAESCKNLELEIL